MQPLPSTSHFLVNIGASQNMHNHPESIIYRQIAANQQAQGVDPSHPQLYNNGMNGVT